MDDIIGDDEWAVNSENFQEFIHKTEKPYKVDASLEQPNNGDDDDNDEAADSSRETDASTFPTQNAGAVTTTTTSLATEMTEEEMGSKLKDARVLTDSFSAGTSETSKATKLQHGGADSPPTVGSCLRSRSSETDVDDIMNEPATDDQQLNGSGAEGESEGRGGAGFIDDDEDDEDEMKEILVFKRQNSRDYLEQQPIEGLLEGIAEEPEEEGGKDIEEEYDSVVIKDDEDDADGSGSDVVNGTGKEVDEEEESEEREQSDEKIIDDVGTTTATTTNSETDATAVTTVVTATASPAADVVTITLIDVVMEDDQSEAATDYTPVPSPPIILEETPESTAISSQDSTLQASCEGQKQPGKLPEEAKSQSEQNKELPEVEPMETTSPSSSDSTPATDDNAAVKDKEPSKTGEESTALENGKFEGPKTKHHDYVNIGRLGRPPAASENLNGYLETDLVTVSKKAAKAEISDDDFCFEPPEGFDGPIEKVPEPRDVSCDYVNVDTIRANKRLASRLMQEGNDEEFERLEAEIISNLTKEEEEESDYCVPRSTSVEKKLDSSEKQQSTRIETSSLVATTDENENVSLVDHQEIEITEGNVLVRESGVSAPKDDDILKENLDFEKKEKDETKQAVHLVETTTDSDIFKAKSEVIFSLQSLTQLVKENGATNRCDHKEDSDSDTNNDYKHPKAYNISSSVKDPEKLQQDDRDEQIEESPTAESGHQSRRSNLRPSTTRPTSPCCETSYNSKSSDILPEAGSVKALVAQWQQMENKRWSRKDDIKAQNGGDQTENRGMNRSRSCGPLPRKVRVLSPDGGLDEEGRRIMEWTVVGGTSDDQQQYTSQPSLTRAMLVKFERLDYETSTSVRHTPPPKKTFKWEVKEPQVLSRPSFLAH